MQLEELFFLDYDLCRVTSLDQDLTEVRVLQHDLSADRKHDPDQVEDYDFKVTSP